MTNHTENKKFFSLPYNLIICFKGEREKYDNQYLKFQLKLDLSSLNMQGPKSYNLKGIINSYVSGEKRFYSCIYQDPNQHNWIMSDGYNKQYADPLVFLNSNIDVVMLFYSSLN